MNAEVKHQNLLIDKMSDDTQSSKDLLQARTGSIKDTRAIGDNFCWMYLIIAGEFALMIFLIYIGIS
jgi:hypothetical protein